MSERFDLAAYVLNEPLPELAVPETTDTVTIDDMEMADSLIPLIGEVVTPGEFMTTMTLEQDDLSDKQPEVSPCPTA